MAVRRVGALDGGGLKAARSALRAVDRELPKQAKDVLWKASQETADRARALLASSPGGNYDPDLVNLRPFKKQTDVGVWASRTRRTPILHSFEYGASRWHIPLFRGRGKPGKVYGRDASSMGRRVLPPPVPKGRNRVGVAQGWVVAPTMARMAPKIDKQLHDDLRKMLDRELDARGIQRG